MSVERPIETKAIYNVARKARCNIDEETRLIENRIRMIRFEEERAHKRIQETREKIEEVYKTRTRYIEENHLKNQIEEKTIKNLTELQDTIRSNRAFHQEKLNYTQQELLNIKKNTAKRVKGWKEYIKRSIQQQSIDQRRNNRKVKEAVKMSSKQGNMRLKLLQDIKEQRARYEYSLKVERENAKRTQVEQQMALLGQEEQELMQRVANIHEIQKQAVEELEKVYS